MDREINQIRNRLLQIDAEREALAARLAELERQQSAATMVPPSHNATTIEPVTITAASAEQLLGR
jgi:hypothetical protein